ncbi:uncharacterized protein LOC132702418 [Cylas formicarius]|uniref:uncharacterized protein LOC132702418 n=1 Tax=Cylas formicarius TaxID=197179 RepID=UPI002958CB02|nr:uncharacterized protein LOC132702418 [Cylas formicarius]
MSNGAGDFFYFNYSRLAETRRNMSRFIVAIVAALVASSSAKPRPKYYDDTLAAQEDYRLPSFYLPSSYQIELIFTQEAFTASGNEFVGKATIKFRFQQDSDVLKFHAHHSYITIDSLTLNNLDIDPTDYVTNDVTDIVTVNFAGAGGLKAERDHTLVVSYKGRIATDMAGVYKSSYVNAKGETVYLVTTQFEPVSARRAFPCFDEPYLKAPFDFVISRPASYNTLFNTAVDSQDTASGMVVERFKTTPIMSTYLVAFVVSDFTCDSGAAIGTVKYQVCSRDNLAGTRAFAVSIGPKILAKLNDFTGYDYGSSSNVTKMDQVAIPDFSAGAMENWGLVTYRESALLYDDEESTNKQSVATVIAHEFAHQWFGNLVTCKWWSETFLNEGFATYFEFFISHEVEELKSWQLDKQFVTSVVQYVMGVDALVTAPSLHSAAATPTEISAKFGTVTYDKGGTVVRMTSHIMGVDNFRKGLQQYLDVYKNGYAEPSDLWTVLNKYVDAGVSNLPTGVSLVDAMENWVEKSGYPLLTVTLSGGSLKIKQERFLLSEDEEDKDTKWYVPITYTTSADLADAFDKTTPVTWLVPSEVEKVIEIPSDTTWVIVNNYQTGYYRVNYDDALWDNLAMALSASNFTGIPDVNRAQIVDDVFTLARTGKVPYSRVFKVISFLENDISYFPWIRALNGLSFIDGKLFESEIKEMHQAHVLGLMRKLYASVPINETKDDQIYTLTQVAAGNWACALGEESCVNAAKTLFSDYKKDASKKPDKNLRRIVYCHGLRNSDAPSDDWEFLWKVYLAAEMASEKTLILAALGCSSDSDVLRRFLSMSVNETSEIRSQDAYSVFSAVYGASALGVDLALDFMIENYKKISEKYTSMLALSSLVTGLASKFTTQAQIDKLKNFITSTTDLPQEFLKAADQAVETAETNLAWIKSYEDDFYEYYGIAQTSGTTPTVTLSLAVVAVAFWALIASQTTKNECGTHCAQLTLSICPFVLNQPGMSLRTAYIPVSPYLKRQEPSAHKNVYVQHCATHFCKRSCALSTTKCISYNSKVYFKQTTFFIVLTKIVIPGFTVAREQAHPLRISLSGEQPSAEMMVFFSTSDLLLGYSLSRNSQAGLSTLLASALHLHDHFQASRCNNISESDTVVVIGSDSSGGTLFSRYSKPLKAGTHGEYATSRRRNSITSKTNLNPFLPSLAKLNTSSTICARFSVWIPSNESVLSAVDIRCHSCSSCCVLKITQAFSLTKKFLLGFLGDNHATGKVDANDLSPSEVSVTLFGHIVSHRNIDRDAAGERLYFIELRLQEGPERMVSNRRYSQRLDDVSEEVMKRILAHHKAEDPSIETKYAKLFVRFAASYLTIISFEKWYSRYVEIASGTKKSFQSLADTRPPYHWCAIALAIEVVTSCLLVYQDPIPLPEQNHSGTLEQPTRNLGYRHKVQLVVGLEVLVGHSDVVVELLEYLEPHLLRPFGLIRDRRPAAHVIKQSGIGHLRTLQLVNDEAQLRDGQRTHVTFGQLALELDLDFTDGDGEFSTDVENVVVLVVVVGARIDGLLVHLYILDGDGRVSVQRYLLDDLGGVNPYGYHTFVFVGRSLKMSRSWLALLFVAWGACAYRLPNNVVPFHYDLHLNLSDEAFTSTYHQYSGIVIIKFNTTELTSQIGLHASYDFINVTLISVSGTDVTDYTRNATSDILWIQPPFTLDPAYTYELYIEFTSRLSTADMYGFYKSSYVADNVTRYLATTQFQPTFARRAFPCFDEPAFKATFEIWITHPNNVTALANTPGTVAPVDDIVGHTGSSVTVKFDTTPPMSTYLVAIVVSDFTCTSGENVEGGLVPYRICSTNDTVEDRTFSVDIGPPLLRSLNSFTDYNYSLMGFPKMDQIAIPDFAAGAMENWGLVTYREALLLWDPLESTNADLQNIATVISHEFGHQWFGNLVTCNWWSELFLNEGFATYFEFFTTHDVLPEWELDKQFVTRVVQRVLETDSLETSQALQSGAESEAEILARFSQVSYLKGGSVLRMVEHVMGTDNFKRGLHKYLQKYAYRTTVPEDLWNTLDEEVDSSLLPRNLSEILANWVKTPGFPLLQVNWAVHSVVVSQPERFLLTGHDNRSSWYVPVSYAFSNDVGAFNHTAPKDWLHTVGFLEIDVPAGANWIILNTQATGFYRVNYDDTLWTNIAAALNSTDFGGIHELNRAQIVDDSFNLVRINKLNYSRVFAIIDFLRSDVSHYPWMPALNGFSFLLRRVGHESNLGNAMRDHVLELLDAVYATVPFTQLNESDHAYTLKQVEVLTAACRMGLPACVNNALERFGEFRINRQSPPKNLRTVIYCNGLRYGVDPQDWDLLWDTYLSTDLAGEKVRILSTLGCTRNETILEAFLQKSITPASGIRPQDALSVFTSVYSSNDVGIDVAFKFLRDHHEQIASSYQSLNALRNMITGLAERFTTENQLEELRRFIETGNLPEDLLLAANQALETAESNQVWLAQYWTELHEYYGLGGTSSTTSPSPSSPPPQTTTPEGSTAADLVSSAIVIVLFAIISSLITFIMCKLPNAIRLDKTGSVPNKNEPLSVTCFILGEMFTSTLLLTAAFCACHAYRLPTIYSPINYNVHLSVLEDAFGETSDNYTGTVSIRFNVTEPTNEIVLHSSSKHIRIENVTVDSVASVNYTVNATTDILTIVLGDVVSNGTEHVLRIDFNGTLGTTNMNGFYRSSYNDTEGVTNYLLTTQFESTNARKAFPCFDEPAYKASFDISLTYPLEFTALSNTPATSINTNLNTGLATTSFETTPVMPTYLVAFIISRFTCTDGTPLEGNAAHPSRVCSRNETADTRSFAVDLAPRYVDVFNTYTGINYTGYVSKLDQVAIPDFAAGAMENWGLITYRETALLYDDNNTAALYQDYVARVIAHELAHQWFGNLVTCKWWSETFLNEGFATLFEYLVPNEVLPEYQLDKQYVIKIVQSIMGEDSYTTAEALRSAASTPTEISAKFGSITYYKGGSVLRMIQHVLGAENFRAALQNYLRDNANGSAKPEDLLVALEGAVNNSVSNLPVGANLSVVLGNWIDRPGFPVVNVTVNETVAVISQERFLFSGNDSSTAWYVPITLTSSNDSGRFQNTAPQYWLTPDGDLTIELGSNVSWIVVNNQQIGFYRVNYDYASWSKLGAALSRANFSDIHEINRAQIVDDAFNLARAGYLPYSRVFEVLEFLKFEASYITWYPAFSGFNYLLRRVGLNTTLGNEIGKHVLRLSSTLKDSVPLQDTNASDHVQSLNRQLANGWFCKLGDGACVRNVSELFEEFKRTSVAPNKNLRSVVYCNALVYSSNVVNDWEFLWSVYENATLATEKATLISALGCAANESVLLSYLRKTITDDSGVRSQDYVSVFQGVYSSSDVGVDVALDFFVENYDIIQSRYTSMRNVIRGIAEYFTTEAQVNKLSAFASSNATNDSAVLEDCRSAITSAKSNLEWARLSRSQLYQYYGLVEEETTTSTVGPITSTTENPNSGVGGSAMAAMVVVVCTMLSCLVSLA